MKSFLQKTQFTRSALMALVAVGSGLMVGACGQKKAACKSCAQPASIDAVTDAANRTKVGVMNFNQLQTNFSSLMGFNRPIPAGSTKTAADVANLVTGDDQNTRGFYRAYGDATRPGLRDSLPISNRISEFSSSQQMSIQKNAFNACDTGIELDLMFYPKDAADTSGRKIIPNLKLTGLGEVATPAARTAVLNRMIEQFWMSNVSWVPTNDEALAVLLPFWDDLITGLPTTGGNASAAEITVLKTMCSVILASAPAQTL